VRSAWVWGFGVLVTVLSGCDSTVRSIPVSTPSPSKLVGRPIVRTGLIIRNQHRRVYSGLSISTRAGDCIQVQNSTDITIEGSHVGPCGGNGVIVTNGSDIEILDNYIHPETKSHRCCDRNDGIFVEGATAVTIQGNVLAYGESNIEATQHATNLLIVGNFLLNPRGPYPRGQNVQAWDAGNVVVRNNYTLSSTDSKRYKYPDDQEDSINFGMGSGFVADDNYVTGGHSPSGCGLIADDGADSARFADNRMVDTGGCGIGVDSGTNQVIAGNRIINRTPVKGAGNTALYVWKQYRHVACGPVELSKNIATEIRRNGAQSGFWDGGGCKPVRLSEDVWDEAARKLLTPPEEKLHPPLIPPKPSHCVIESPYSSQTKWPAC
jgi:hypothetical protein